ncbi:MAG: NUDIX domain-containing protein [Chloroflexi bacterium]|nr:NUDIX domain-containing protein [Chloroflexota bacterium]
MKITVIGILVNHLNQVLLIKRNDTRTWAAPGGAMEAGELPTDAVARELREETGIIAMPARLVALSVVGSKSEPHLELTFRCIQRGGEIEPSDESPQVGFIKVNKLPKRIATYHRQRLEVALQHKGGPVTWKRYPVTVQIRFAWLLLRNIIYPIINWRKQRNGMAYTPPPDWQTSAFTIIRDDKGNVLWVKRRDKDVWNLPGGVGNADEAPWETAVRETQEETGLTVKLTDITGIYVYQSDQPHMVFVFHAKVISGQLTIGDEAAAFDYFSPGNEPKNSVQQHLQRVTDATDDIEQTTIAYQEGPHLVIK